MIENNLKTMTINFGPQHPAAHGVLRLLINLDGEIVKYVDPHIGLLHRGSEKLIETKNVTQSLPYFDRFDYVSMMSQEHVYSMAVENFFDIKIPMKASYIRVLFLELTRILNHILAITTHALDVGALTPFLWGFEEREQIMFFYECVSGARMHASYICPGGVVKDIPFNLLSQIMVFLNRLMSRILEIEKLLSFNRIWQSRLKGVGKISKKKAIDYSFSGVMLRGSGTFFDLRLNFPYECYNTISFSVPIGTEGDCFDRYLVRLQEIIESINICLQIIPLINHVYNIDLFKISDFKLGIPIKSRGKLLMEDLIHHFKLSTENLILPKSHHYISAEAPKGEFGVYLEGNNSAYATRCRIRAPGFFHLQALNFMSKGSLLADLVTIIGTQDIVFGEIDR